MLEVNFYGLELILIKQDKPELNTQVASNEKINLLTIYKLSFISTSVKQLDSIQNSIIPLLYI